MTRLTRLVPLLGVPRPTIGGLVLGSSAPATLRWSYKASHARASDVSLPAVGAHERHRGGNSTPLDIPVGDRSGPVTKIQGRVGVAVHQLPAPRARPRSLAQPEVRAVAAAAVMGLGGGEPAVSYDELPSRPIGLVGQDGADHADSGLIYRPPERGPAHAPRHGGNVQVLHDDRAVAACQPGSKSVKLVGAEVGRSPVKGRQLGVRVTVASGADDAAGRLPGDPAALGVGRSPGGWMVTRWMLPSACATTAHCWPCLEADQVCRAVTRSAIPEA